MTNGYDAVVVGGGLGGAIALRELQSRGLRCVLLEARDRLGGRAWPRRTNRHGRPERALV